MKKLKCLLFLTPLFLVACFHPPIPNVEEAALNADPNTVILLSNENTGDYFRAALPFQASSVRGLILNNITNRADLEQIEMSMMRVATDYFDPEVVYFQEGQNLSREFVLNLLRLNQADPEFPFESAIGLNPSLGSSHVFGGRTFESTAEDQIRPLIFLIEQNFITFDETEEAQLEGISIVLALNPYYREIDQSIGHDQTHRRTEEDLIAIGEEMASNLVPLLRERPGLEEVPILIGLFVLKPNNAVIPGHLASVAYVEAGRSSIQSFTDVHERHFSLPDPTNTLQNYVQSDDASIVGQFNDFRDAMINYFPFPNGIVSRVHLVNREVYRVSIVFNMHFSSASERMAFFQLLEREITTFSDRYEIQVTVRSLEVNHGTVHRPAYGEVSVNMLNW